MDHGSHTTMGGRTVRRDVKAAGFTLIEMMVVVIILGILAGMVVPRLMGRPEQAKQVRAEADIRALETALRLYRLDNGRYPTTEQGLQALVQAPQIPPKPRNWRTGGYLEKKRVPLDPWGTDYLYVSPGEHDDFDLSSLGADGTAGGEEYDRDINHWEME